MNKQLIVLQLYKILNGDEYLGYTEICKKMEAVGYKLANNTFYYYLDMLKESGCILQTYRCKYRIADKNCSAYIKGRREMLNEVVCKLKSFERHNIYYEDVIEETKDYLQKLKLRVDNEQN